MSQLEQLPADQRAVLSLLLRQGKSYREVAVLLHIDESAVAQRAQTALAALGPRGGAALSAGRRHDLGDYLLGQQSASDRSSTREYLQGSASGRAWARVVSSELSGLAPDGLPEVPAEGRTPSSAPSAPTGAAAIGAGGAGGGQPRSLRPGSVDPASTTARSAGADPQATRPSRRGGALLLAGLGAVLAAVVVLILSSGSGSSKNTGSVTSSAPPPAVTTAPGSTSTPGATAPAPGATVPPGVAAPVTPSTPGSSPATSTAGQPTPVGQARLAAVKGASGLAVATVYRQGAQRAFAILAQGLPAAPVRSYAVWLYNSATDSVGLGLVPSAVGADGRFQVVGPVPNNAAHWRQMIVTREHVASPKRPGTILLQGALQLSG